MWRLKMKSDVTLKENEYELIVLSSLPSALKFNKRLVI